MKLNKSVCIVDDRADFLFLVKQIFRLYISSYSLHFFESGYALLNELPNLYPRPSLILLDRHLPDLDGHQVLLLLKEHPVWKQIPVVMLSADASDVEISECYASGANSFLTKKQDFNELRGMIKDTCQYWIDINQELD